LPHTPQPTAQIYNRSRVHLFHRRYCGEEVAFLFHFLAFLQYWLVIPAVTGGALSVYMVKPCSPLIPTKT